MGRNQKYGNSNSTCAGCRTLLPGNRKSCDHCGAMNQETVRCVQSVRSNQYAPMPRRCSLTNRPTQSSTCGNAWTENKVAESRAAPAVAAGSNARVLLRTTTNPSATSGSLSAVAATSAALSTAPSTAPGGVTLCLSNRLNMEAPSHRGSLRVAPCASAVPANTATTSSAIPNAPSCSSTTVAASAPSSTSIKSRSPLRGTVDPIYLRLGPGAHSKTNYGVHFMSTGADPRSRRATIGGVQVHTQARSPPDSTCTTFRTGVCSPRHQNSVAAAVAAAQAAASAAASASTAGQGQRPKQMVQQLPGQTHFSPRLHHEQHRQQHHQPQHQLQQQHQPQEQPPPQQQQDQPATASKSMQPMSSVSSQSSQSSQTSKQVGMALLTGSRPLSATALAPAPTALDAAAPCSTNLPPRQTVPNPAPSGQSSAAPTAVASGASTSTSSAAPGTTTAAASSSSSSSTTTTTTKAGNTSLGPREALRNITNASNAMTATSSMPASTTKVKSCAVQRRGSSLTLPGRGQGGSIAKAGEARQFHTTTATASSAAELRRGGNGNTSSACLSSVPPAKATAPHAAGCGTVTATTSAKMKSPGSEKPKLEGTRGTVTSPQRETATAAAAALASGARGGGSVAKAVGSEEKYARSSVSETLEGMKQFRGCPEEDIDAVLGEYVDPCLDHCHLMSQRHVPDVARLCARFRDAERGPILNWLIQAFHEMQFHESLLFVAISLLDRYCALAQTDSPITRSVLMAVISTSLKTQAVQDEVCATMHFREQLSFMCHNQISSEDILTTECEVLATLQFNVTVPTVFDFIDILSFPLLSYEANEAEACPPRSMAHFLTQLAVFDGRLYYRYPHLVLAAAAMGLALVAFQALPAVYQTLMADISLACHTDVTELRGAVGACSDELLTLWQIAVAQNFEQQLGLFRKFSGARLNQSLLLRPPSRSQLLGMA